MSGDIRNCAYCGHDFVPVRRAQRYCDTECHDAYYARRAELFNIAILPVPLISVAAVSFTMG